MKKPRIKHIAVAVRDIEHHAKLLSRIFGVASSEPIEVHNQGVKVVFLEFANIKIELIAPLDESASISKFLQKRGEGLHHLCISTDDVSATLRELVSDGIELVDKVPRGGAEQKPVAFIHPKSTGGILFEIEED